MLDVRPAKQQFGLITLSVCPVRTCTIRAVSLVIPDSQYNHFITQEGNF